MTRQTRYSLFVDLRGRKTLALFIGVASLSICMALMYGDACANISETFERYISSGSPGKAAVKRTEATSTEADKKSDDGTSTVAVAYDKTALSEEDRLLREVVQPMDRESLKQWLSSFISLKPWNCPVHQQGEWVEAIISAIERNHLPLSKEIAAVVATLISIESGFHADPLLVDGARRGGNEALLQRAEKKFFEKYGAYLDIPPIPKYYAAYREKYWDQLLACRTAGDIEVVSGRMAQELRKDCDNFPGVIRKTVDKEIDKLAHIVRSKGSMQLKLFRARQAMKDRGEEFTDQELTDYMYTLPGGVDVGVAALRPLFIQYGARAARKNDLSWLFFVGMDYHYGPFSSRNMMEQVRLRDLSGRNIPIDGSFLNHDGQGVPERQDSETLLAAVKALSGVSKQKIFEAFLLERYPQYVYTEIHQLIKELHEKKFGPTPFALIGEIRVGESAEIKFGATWTTRLYLNKLDRYFNSVPWDN